MPQCVLSHIAHLIDHDQVIARPAVGSDAHKTPKFLRLEPKRSFTFIESLVQRNDSDADIHIPKDNP